MSTTTPPSKTAASARPLDGTSVPCYVFSSNVELAERVAQAVAGVIRERNALGEAAVLGLNSRGHSAVTSRPLHPRSRYGVA